MIEVEEVVYEYPQRRALDGINFVAPAQSVMALVGPNGAGKSTLLRCLAGLDAPLSGRITVDGVDVARAPREAHRRVGFLSDFFGLYDDLTAAQSLRYAALARGVARARVGEAVERAAARTELTGRLDEKAGQLSRGWRQRLGVAMAIVHEPKLLLLDEPAAGLDPEARRSLSNLILALRDAGMTLMVSSHILSELEDYCDRMIAIDKGVLRGGGVIEKAAIGRTRIVLALARPFPGLEETLTSAGARLAAMTPEIEVELDGGPEAQAGLLRALVAAGAPVCAFAPRQRTLEQAYFEEALGRTLR